VRVIVTRAAAQAEPLVAALRASGFDVVVCPLIDIEPIDDGPIDVRGYDWVIVTSVNGAIELARRRSGDVPRVAAIGTATAAALREHGLAVDFVPRQATQDALVAELPRPAGRALFVGAEGARRLIVSELGADFRAVYRTRLLRPHAPPQGDLAVLASPSAARAFAGLAPTVPVVTIGPQTTAAAREAGLVVLAEAPDATVDALVATVQEAAG
jgi:uroporphyrinogen-III synthase